MSEAENGSFNLAQQLANDQAQDQQLLNGVLEESKNEYFRQIEDLLPKEPNDEEDFYNISVRAKNGTGEYSRKFGPNDSVNDIKNFAKCKLRKNSDIAMFTESDKILFDTSAKIKDSGIGKQEKIIVTEDDDI